MNLYMHIISNFTYPDLRSALCLDIEAVILLQCRGVRPAPSPGSVFTDRLPENSSDAFLFSSISCFFLRRSSSCRDMSNCLLFILNRKHLEIKNTIIINVINIINRYLFKCQKTNINYSLIFLSTTIDIKVEQ